MEEEEEEAYDYKFVKWMIKEKVNDLGYFQSAVYNITLKPTVFYCFIIIIFHIETGSHSRHRVCWRGVQEAL